MLRSGPEWSWCSALQIALLQILLPEFDVPVRLELVSDNATQVQIQRVGTFGPFSKREIELKPGNCTVSDATGVPRRRAGMSRSHRVGTCRPSA